MSNHNMNKMTHKEMLVLAKQDLTTGVGRSVKHESASKQVCGEAVYIDDRLEFPNQLHVYARMSERAHAKITKLDVSPCYEFAGVAIAITAQDIPGQLDIGAVLPGDPLLADGLVEFVGQPVLAVGGQRSRNSSKSSDGSDCRI